MLIQPGSGPHVCIRNGKLEVLTSAPGCYKDCLRFDTLSGGILTDQGEFYEQYEAYAHMSDDGNQYYEVIKPLVPAAMITDAITAAYPLPVVPPSRLRQRSR